MDPRDVVGRDGDVARIWESLSRGRGALLLNEPRRIGKTSTLVRMGVAPPAPWVYLRQSFQGVSTTAGLVELALKDVHRHRGVGRRARAAARSFLANSTVKTAVPGVAQLELAAPFKDDPIAAFERALRDVDGALGEQRLLLAWDEVPDMFTAIADNQGEEAASRALALLRRLRDSQGVDAISWLLTGSVGLHHVVRRLGRDDLINDVEHVKLGPLDVTWTRWLSCCLLMGAGVQTPDRVVVDELAEASGGIAFLVHLAAKEVRDQRRITLKSGEVSRLLDDAIGDVDRGHQMTAFLTRLHRYYGEDAAFAEWLLDQTAHGSLSRSELRSLPPPQQFVGDDHHLRTVLDWLCADHYLEATTVDGHRRYAWRYPALLRIWVLRRL